MQNNVNLRPFIAYEGMMQTRPLEVASGICNERIYAGKAVSIAPAAAMAGLPARVNGFTTGQILYGIVPADTTLERLPDPVTGLINQAPFGAYGANDTAPVVRKGQVWVRTDTVVADLSRSVFIRDADVTGTAATVVALAAQFPVADQVGLTLTINIAGFAPQLVTFAAATTTAAHVAAEINAQIVGGRALVNAGGDVVIQTDEVGAHVTIAIVAGTSVVAWEVPADGTGVMVPAHIASRGTFRDVAAADYTEITAANGLKWLRSTTVNTVPFALLGINL